MRQQAFVHSQMQTEVRICESSSIVGRNEKFQRQREKFVVIFTHNKCAPKSTPLNRAPMVGPRSSREELELTIIAIYSKTQRLKDSQLKDSPTQKLTNSQLTNSKTIFTFVP